MALWQDHGSWEGRAIRAAHYPTGAGRLVRDQVARLRLTGGCDSAGSTFTIANQVMPTLRRLPTVSWVKIYDPRGRTEQPSGRSDSIPTCLEP